jgi:hypothetical protein
MMRKVLFVLLACGVLGLIPATARSQQPPPRPLPVAPPASAGYGGVSPYRAGIVPAPATLTSPRPPLVKSTLSPYLNLVRNQNDNGLVSLGIDYYLGTRTEIARRTNERILADEIGRQQAVAGQVPATAGTTGHRTYFDSSYGRPAGQLYRRR